LKSVIIIRNQAYILRRKQDGQRIFHRSIDLTFQASGINEGMNFAVYINGKDAGIKLTARSEPITLHITDLPNGLHVFEVQVLDSAKNVIANAVHKAQKWILPERVQYLNFSVHPVSWTNNQSDTVDAVEMERDAIDDAHVRNFFGDLWADDSESHIERSDPLFLEYEEFHRSTIANLSSWTDESIGFLILRTSNVGLGNQLQALVSFFALALVTRRILLIDATMPLALLEQRALRWDYAAVHAILGSAYIAQRSQLVDLTWLNPAQFPPLLCDDLSSRALFPARFLFAFTDQYFLPALAHNPHCVAAGFGRALGPDPFRTIARRVLRPRPAVLREAARFLAAATAGGGVGTEQADRRRRRLVGIHVRTATMRVPARPCCG
jgi:hypothetical protein